MNISEYETRIKSFFEQEKYEKAIEYIETNLFDNPAHNLSKIYLALAYFCLGNDEIYQTILLDLLFNNQEEELIILSQSILNIAELKLNQQHTDLAIKLYQQVLEIDAQSIVAYINLAQLFTQKSNFDDAVFLWQELISIQPNLIISYQNLGLL
ncbi:MAG: tetratricopeptide repeat protein, partial [Cyanobacteria bacterium]|nr:tetratricopeptide repeat protein [Cyanobacteria bacterium CG_2015-02_32_10]